MKLKQAVIILIFLGILFPGTSVSALEPKAKPLAAIETRILQEDLKPQPTEPIYLRLNLPATRLDLYVADQFVKSYRVAIGTTKYPTPIRDYELSDIIWNPWWYPPDSEWAQDAEKTPPGPGNPLGVVKMIMHGAAGMRIHGTNAPRSIGRAASHACLRMLNNEARELAWEIQKRYSEKNDEELLDKYKRNRRRSYYVKLFERIPVYTEYSQVERKADRLLLHPNRYWRRGFKDELQMALSDQKDLILDKKLIRKLDRMRRRKTIEISLDEIRQMILPVKSSLAQQEKI